MKTAVMIVGHGSRDSGSDSAVKRIVEAIKMGSSGEIVEYAFLQHAQPTPGEALDRCVRQGAKKIVLVPFFMQSGVHVTRDIPAFVEKAKKQHPAMDIRVTAYVGAHPLMQKIIIDLVEKAKGDRQE
jgi:sirohydrochlorin ferrochelatase